jgi:phosphopantothenoylcysteine decarboxylase/phosphopantothenate--cysteine ligase, prokaryotic
MLKGKTVVIGVCGGIAAYKAVDIASRLKKLEANIEVIMTENATRFVTPLTFQSIIHRHVITGTFDEPEQWDIKHISLAKKADIFVIAPATANIIGKIAGGIADDMLSTTVLATKSPVLIIPAMNTNMYENSIVQDNINKLKSLGYIIMEPDTGLLAEGISGKGRLPEPQTIVDEICRTLKTGRDMTGRRVLVTAGPTREPIDPVRYISNRSSGKMGYAVARAASDRGAFVKLVTGPVSIKAPENVNVMEVVTASEMYSAVMDSYKDYDIIIMVAAVADYKCAEIADRKIKKNENEMYLRLEKNPDILKELGMLKEDRILVGACAETNDLIDNAKLKLFTKNLDMIIANDVTIEGAGFETDTNIIKILKKDGSIIELPKMSKLDAAHKILDEIVKGLSGNIYAKHSG